MKYNGIEFTSDRLIDLAMAQLGQSQGDVDFDFSERLTQQSIAYSLIAIGQELKKFNDRIDEDRKSESRTIDEDIRRGFIRIEEKIIGSSEQ